MSVPNFKNGLMVNGVPIIPFATQGNVYFVRPKNGSDTGVSGKNIKQAFKTLAKAYDTVTANQNDTVVLVAESNTSADTTDYQSSTLTWGKDLVHLIGVGAPTAVSQRARIAQLSTATGVSPLVNFTANGCIVHNVSLFHGVNDATSLVAGQITGQRNYFSKIHFGGIGHATMVTAGAASLKIDGGSENVFEDCVIGVDTITRDNNCAEIWFDTAATRNVFKNCLIQGHISNAGYVHVKIEDSTGIDRWLRFINCEFLSESTNDGTTQTSVFSIPVMSQGYVILDNCFHVTPGASGSGDWDSNNRGRLYANMGAPTAAAAGGISTKQ